MSQVWRQLTGVTLGLRSTVFRARIFLAAGKRFLFSDLGEAAIRGFEDPVKLWELRWED